MTESGTTERADLGRAAARGARVTAVGQGLKFALQSLSIVVLARLLAPDDYGVMAMAMVFVTFAEVIRDFGLSSAAVQAKELSREQQHNLFWVNTAIGLILTLLMTALAPVIAALFGEPRLVTLVSVLAWTFVLNGMSAQYMADLSRRMRFRGTVVVTLGSQAIGLAVGVTAAVAGADELALGFMSVGSSAAALGLALMLVRWLPGRYHRDAPMRSFFRFGGGMLGAQLLGASAYQAHSLVLGTTLGATQLGTYSRAYQLITLPLNQMQSPATRVALPVLARVQDDDVAFLALLRRGQTALLHVTAFVIAVPSALAPVLIPLVLGDQWSDISTPFRILAFAGIANMGSYVCYWIYLARGHTGLYLTFSAWARPLTIVAVVIGGFGGVNGVAIAFSTVMMVLWPLNYWWLVRRSTLAVWPLFANALRIVGVHVTVAGAAGLVLWLLRHSADPLSLAAASATLVAGYLAWFVLAPAFRRDVIGLRALARRG